jgi:hypothetical protein
VLGYLPGGLPGLLVSFAVGAVGFGVIGLRLLTGTDASCDQMPEPARSPAKETVPLSAPGTDGRAGYPATVPVGHCRPPSGSWCYLPAQHQQLVTQHRDLHVLGVGFGSLVRLT